MILNVSWHNGVNLCTMVQETHTALPTDFYPGHVLNPIPSVKGVRIQEGSLCMAFYALVSHPDAPSVCLPFLEGLNLPSLVLFPPSGLKASLFLFPPAMGNRG